MLEKMEMIKSRREGIKYRAFYITGVKFPKHEKYRFSELQNSILELIKNNRGITQKEIASTLGMKQQTINYNVKMLQRSDIIKLEKKGRITHCFMKGET
jgi:predicted transcriptional regulator